MQILFESFSQQKLWDSMWTQRTTDQELDACNMHSPLRELLLSYLPPKGKILEAGCGFGKWVIYLHRHGYNIMGIDNNDLAVAKLKGFPEPLQVEMGDILDIHYPDNSFDAYISIGVIEHFEDGPILALKEAYRVLKPNGLIFISVPTVNVIRKIIRQPLRNVINMFPTSVLLLISGWGKSKRNSLRAAIGHILPLKRNKKRHFIEYRYSKSELENLLKQSGFDVVETVSDDYYGSEDHAVGLVVDFPFLASRDGVNFHLNIVGRPISRLLDKVSPWIACSMVLCIGRTVKINDIKVSDQHQTQHGPTANEPPIVKTSVESREHRELRKS